MKLIVKLFPEITIKSTSVRLHFIKILSKNISALLEFLDCVTVVKRHWDYIEILVHKYSSILDVVESLVHIPGIHHILLVKKYFFDDIDSISEKIIPVYRYRLIGKNFCVRVKRCGQHNFTSQDVERYVGAMLCKNIQNTSVKLNDPEELINLEVRQNYFLLIKNRYKGLCGFPIGTQGDVLSLISGGFDSGIASYMLIRRGCKVHYCFFNIGGDFHENAVRKVAYFLWKKYGSSHLVKFVSVDFSFVLEEILKKISNAYMGVVLKRMMLRAASLVASRLKISALVTGEILGQVSSQTLTNLQLIDSVTDIMIFRPLISYDKEDVISLSKDIGIEDFLVNIPEYCGIISRKPTARARKEFVEIEESRFDFSILYSSINQSKIINICNVILENNLDIEGVQFLNKLNSKFIIVDIRIRVERERNPLCLDMVEIRNIPFYKLSSVFSTLDQNKTYLLYCARGVMSHWQAVCLRNRGFKNVHVYLP